MHLACGLSVGLTGLAAGYTIGTVGDTGMRAYMVEQKIFVGMVLILIFGEVLGLYGYDTLDLPFHGPSHLFLGFLLTSKKPDRCPYP